MNLVAFAKTFPHAEENKENKNVITSGYYMSDGNYVKLPGDWCMAWTFDTRIL